VTLGRSHLVIPFVGALSVCEQQNRIADLAWT
jgi:hypothetical protein